jgi:hypothetical protein
MIARESWVRIAAGLVALGVTFCGRTVDPGSSESHFLATCADTCSSGFSCLCGLCTKVCGSDVDCSGLASGARCVAQSGADSTACSPALGSGTGICDLQCQTPADCAALGGGFDCVQNRCRTSTTSGTGGSGNEGGASASNGGGSAFMGGCQVEWPDFRVEYDNQPATPCPASPPTAGEPCDSTVYGVACVYQPEAEFAHVFLCNADSAPGVWTETYALCHQDCTLPSDATWTVLPPSDCLSGRTGVNCPTTGHTPQENMSLALLSVYDACVLGSENSILVTLEQGCATAFSIAFVTDQAVVDCVTQRLSSERYSCANKLACASAERSTLP